MDIFSQIQQSFEQLSGADQLIVAFSLGIGLLILIEFGIAIIGMIRGELTVKYEGQYVQFSIYCFDENAMFVGIIFIVHGLIFTILMVLNYLHRLPGVMIGDSWIDYVTPNYGVLVILVLGIVYFATCFVVLSIAESFADRITNY